MIRGRKAIKSSIPAIFLFMFLIFCIGASSSQEIPDWENPLMFNQNKERSHATFISYPDSSFLFENNRKESPFYRPLNGLWKFYWVEKPADCPEGFYEDDFDTGDWKEIEVPSNWEFALLPLIKEKDPRLESKIKSLIIRYGLEDNKKDETYE